MGVRTVVVVVATALTALPALCLEKVEVPFDGDRSMGAWNAGTTCSVSYFNNCTGWLWVWSGWLDGDVLGMVYDPCCENAILESTSTYIWTGSGPSWGFTGTIGVSEDLGSGCVGALLAQQSFLPRSGPNTHTWNLAITGPIILTMNMAATLTGWSAIVIASDHPAVGPTGPPACGFCYPVERLPHSFYFGNTIDGTACPGSPLFDGVCTAEWFRWSASFSCATGIENKSWGAIKNLYR